MNSLSPRAAIGLFLIVVLAWGVNWSVTKQLVQFLPRCGRQRSGAGSRWLHCS